MDEISRADLDDGIFLGNVLGSFFLEELKGDFIEPQCLFELLPSGYNMLFPFFLL